MKVFVDPIYTNSPANCATTAKIKKLVMHVLNTTTDVFFYWLIPHDLTDEQKTYFPNDPRVVLYPYSFYSDRMREYLRLFQDYENYVGFQGLLWDIDIVITNRTMLVPQIQMMMNKPMRSNQWSKKVFLIENFPIMKFKHNVGLSEPDAQSRMTILGLRSADMSIVSSFWEKAEILKEARDTYSPAFVRDLSKHLIEGSQIYVDNFSLKTPEQLQPMLSGGREFTMAYIGRLTNSKNPEEALAVMTKQWLFRKGQKKLRILVSTQSQGSNRVDVPSHVDLHYANRDQFWHLVKEEIDVYCFLSKAEGYSMSLIEPLILGCPAIVSREDWSLPTLGPDYPFYVSGELETYALLKKFYDDYEGQYKIFSAWLTGPFKEILEARNKVYIPFVFESMIQKWWGDFHVHGEKHTAIERNSITKLLIEEGGDEFVIQDAISSLDRKGVTSGLSRKFTDAKNKILLSFGTDWNYFRLGLMYLGYRDASVKVGHMRRI